jgi:hypothetical protein
VQPAVKPPNNSLHLTRGAGAPLAGELNRWHQWRKGNMTESEEERYRILKRKHQQLLRDWKRNKGPCIICAEREGDERDHLPPRVLFPASLRSNETTFFTFPVCPKCNRASSDEDFLFSALLSFGLNQESIRDNQEPSDPDLLALYKQAQGHFEDQRDADRRTRLLQPFIEKDPHCGRPAINLKTLPVNQTLTKMAKSIYWLNTDGDILQKYNPGWWIRRDVDTSKELFIQNHLKTTHAEIHWGDGFISHFTIGHAQEGVGGFISCSLHFYTNRAVGKGMSWWLIASPVNTSVKGVSLYEWSKGIWGAATIEPTMSAPQMKSKT